MNIVKHVELHTKQHQSSATDKLISNKETLCERCKRILASSAVEKQNYHNKNQIKHKPLLDDESSHRQYADGGENESFSGGSSDDDPTVVGHVSMREVIGEVSRTKNTVSMLRKQFENIDNKKAVRKLERQISEKFFKRTKSPARTTIQDDDGNASAAAQPSANDYYVIEQTKVYKVLNNSNKETVTGKDPLSAALPADKISKILLSKRSLSNGDIKRIKRSPSHDVIAEEPFVLNERTKSMEQMVEDSEDVEYRNISIGNNRRSVRTVDDILQQERFSKCYSEYSISDLLNDMPDDDDSDFASFFSKN